MEPRSTPEGPLNLKAERLNRGLTAKECAVEIGIPDYVLRYAEDHGRPRPWAAKLIADYFGTTVTTQWPMDEAA